jgi:hypothetical protein
VCKREESERQCVRERVNVWERECGRESVGERECVSESVCVRESERGCERNVGVCVRERE